MHGTFMDATTWFNPESFGQMLNETDKPLPLRLWDEGYDVWLANMRGTQYSRKHVYQDPSNSQSIYWNFTWAEKGMLDVPAAIKQIKKISNVDKVAYIGYS